MIAVSPEVVRRVRMEYLEMPGLALTAGQARRLFNLDTAVCEDILAQLVREHFLARSVGGVFLRRAMGWEPCQTGQIGVVGQAGPRTYPTADRI